MLLINMDTLLTEQDSIPDGGRCSVLEPESAEVELPLANAMHQLDARNRGRGTPEPFEAEYHVRSGLDISMVLLDQIVQVLRGPDLRVLSQKAIGLHFTHRPVRSSIPSGTGVRIQRKSTDGRHICGQSASLSVT